VATAAEDRLNFRRNPYASFAAATVIRNRDIKFHPRRHDPLTPDQASYDLNVG
jgi:hypothetical protein